jgi:hypothetical protein
VRVKYGTYLSIAACVDFLNKLLPLLLAHNEYSTEYSLQLFLCDCPISILEHNTMRSLHKLTISNRLKAYLSISSFTTRFVFIVADKNSLKSMVPEPSTSIFYKISSMSPMSPSRPKRSLNISIPFASSSLVIVPSPS